MISVVMIDSRSDKHPDWVELAKNSVLRQAIDCELIVVDNIGRKKTIGQCWNEGVKAATHDFVFFLGDDDWIVETYLGELYYYAIKNPKFTMYTTYMTAYIEEENKSMAYLTICTGMWRKDYLLKRPFNEELKKGIDREYIEEMKKRGDVGFTVPHNFGYYYRKHSDYSCAGEITLTKDQPQIYVLTSGRNFIDPIVKEWKKTKKVHVTSERFDPKMADGAEVIWCEWLREDAITASQHKCKAKKILRIHSYEAFTPLIYYVDFSKFDKVIFIAEHIKDFVESKVGKIKNAVVIPVGVHVNGFDPSVKRRNNKIAYAGEISRKKGIGELLFIAKSLPDYEFHVAGKFTEEDVARHFNEKKPKNVFLHPYSYNLPEFFKDKTFFLNTSIREGNPVTVLEAMSYGLKPLINDWVGAEGIYKDYVFKDIDSLKSLLEEYNPKEYRDFVEEYKFDNTYGRLESLLKE